MGFLGAKFSMGWAWGWGWGWLWNDSSTLHSLCTLFPLFSQQRLLRSPGIRFRRLGTPVLKQLKGREGVLETDTALPLPAHARQHRSRVATSSGWDWVLKTKVHLLTLALPLQQAWNRVLVEWGACSLAAGQGSAHSGEASWRLKEGSWGSCSDWPLLFCAH